MANLASIEDHTNSSLAQAFLDARSADNSLIAIYLPTQFDRGYTGTQALSLSTHQKDSIDKRTTTPTHTPTYRDMPDAKASGADTGGGARARDHNQGNQGRSYTVEQKAAVLRIRRCNATSFYEILDIESVRKTCTEAEIKKAYRKQSLLTHPDKNGHENADEAFKMVSRAFGVLGDKEKREKYDRYGTDPDSRFASAQAQNPFSGFASRQPSAGRQGGPMGGGGGWDDDISPEEMFARFFGGGGGGFGGFGGGGGTAD